MTPRPSHFPWLRQSEPVGLDPVNYWSYTPKPKKINPVILIYLDCNNKVAKNPHISATRFISAECMLVSHWGRVSAKRRGPGFTPPAPLASCRWAVVVTFHLPFLNFNFFSWIISSLMSFLVLKYYDLMLVTVDWELWIGLLPKNKLARKKNKHTPNVLFTTKYLPKVSAK